MSDTNIIIEESSVIGILGERGHGKSVILTKLGYNDYLVGKKIVANYHLNFPHIYMTFEEIIELPEELEDCTLLLDEFQVGAGARKALSNANTSINKFITQLRKRNIMLYYATQHIRFVDIDVRTQTNFVIFIRKIDKSIFDVKFVDRWMPTAPPINHFTWDATDFFEKKLYDTKEIISFGKDG